MISKSRLAVGLVSGSLVAGVAAAQTGFGLGNIGTIGGPKPGPPRCLNCPAPDASGNVIPDGSFDVAKLSPAWRFQGQRKQGIIDGAGRGSTRALRLPSGTDGIVNATVRPNTRYVLHAWIKPEPNGTADARAWLEWGVEGNPDHHVLTKIAGDAADWQEITDELKTGAQEQMIDLVAFTSTKGQAAYLIDDLSVRPVVAKKK